MGADPCRGLRALHYGLGILGLRASGLGGSDFRRSGKGLFARRGSLVTTRMDHEWIAFRMPSNLTP